VYTMDWPGPIIVCMYVWERCPTHSDPQIHLLWPYCNTVTWMSAVPYNTI
jgi:hypothetical protein